MTLTVASKIRGWYIYDEPEYSLLGGISPDPTSTIAPLPTISVETLKEFGAYVRWLDPTRPTLLNNSAQVVIDGELDGWHSVADFHSIDDYPKYVMPDPTPYKPDFEPFKRDHNSGWWTVPEVFDAVETKQFGRNSYYVAQGYSDAGRAALSLREVRWSAWTPLIKGLQGVLFWWWPDSSWDKASDGSTIRQSVGTVFNEIHRLKIPGILFAGENHNSAVADPKLAGMALRLYKGTWYFLVSNNVDQGAVRTVNFQLKMPPPPGVCPSRRPDVDVPITEMISGAQITASVTCSLDLVDFTAHLERGDVRAYKLWAASSPDEGGDSELPPPGAGQPGSPQSPSNLSASASQNRIDLTWDDNSDNEDGFVIEYTYDLPCLTGDSNCLQIWARVPPVGADVTNYVHQRSCGTQLSYRVRAYNAVGESLPSDAVYVRTLPCTSPP